MRRYTNPTITVTISPASVLESVTELYFMMKQDSSGAELIKTTSSGVTVDASTGTVSYMLSRDESNGFTEGPALVQVKGRTDGKYWASDIGEVQVKRILSTGDGSEFISGEDWGEVIG